MIEQKELPIDGYDWNICEKEVFIKNAEKYKGDFSFLVLAARKLKCPEEVNDLVIGNEIGDLLKKVVDEEGVKSLNQILDFLGQLGKDNLSNCYRKSSYMDDLDIYKGHTKLSALPDGILGENLWKAYYKSILKNGKFREREDANCRDYFEMLLRKKFPDTNPSFLNYNNGEYTFQVGEKEYSFTVAIKAR